MIVSLVNEAALLVVDEKKGVLVFGDIWLLRIGEFSLVDE
jgi:hypothetical protein